LKSGRLIEVGRLTEVPYKLVRKGSKHDFMASIWQNAFKKRICIKINPKSNATKTSSAFPAQTVLALTQRARS